MSLSGRTRPLSKIGLSMFLIKVCFLNFRYFFITCFNCKHINTSDQVNYILFITVKTITARTTISHFEFKTSLTIFKFMRFANSNDGIFNKDLASLNASSFKMSYSDKVKNKNIKYYKNFV